MNEIMESLYQRKSMRVYEDREIPEEMKKTVISWKLVTETIRRWDIAQKEGCLISYNGLGWMLQFLPIEFRTKEVCIEVCKRYPYAIEHVPNKIIEDDSFWEELLRNEYFAPLLQLEKKQIKHNMNRIGICCNFTEI